MAELFKNVFNPTSIGDMANALSKAAKETQLSFEREGFYAKATENLETQELKQRSDQIVQALLDFLPSDYHASAEMIENALAPVDTKETALGINQWLVMPVTEYVGKYGQGHFERSMALFHSLTQRFSAEFGIRHFLLSMPAPTLDVLKTWTQDESVHVRRLASEGTRPTLPWGIALPHFLKDPALTYGILEALKDDPEEYVRRSVANHLNDLSKKHPEWFANVAESWMKHAPAPRVKLVKHAARTLFKQGHPDVLALFGLKPVSINNLTLSIEHKRVQFGEGLTFNLSGELGEANECTLMVDFVIHHKKANGTLTPKVFKWKTVTLKKHAHFSWEKFHPMKPITTRKYYPGEHRLELVINGQSVATAEFELLM